MIRLSDCIVLTIGTFDTFHIGHLRLLQRAAQFGELHVGVNSDEFVKRYKGVTPMYDMSDRRSIVGALECVTETYFNWGSEMRDDRLDGGRELIFRVMPHLLVIGSDWHENGYLDQLEVTQEELDAFRIGVLYLPRTPGVSSSAARA